nr:hypothetical protein [Variovorax sp. PBL-H6]
MPVADSSCVMRRLAAEGTMCSVDAARDRLPSRSMAAISFRDDRLRAHISLD